MASPFDERVAELKKQYDLGQINRRELLNKLLLAGATASVAASLLGETPAEAASQDDKKLTKSTKEIKETTEDDWHEALKKEGITDLKQLVSEALKHAKAHPGNPKPGADWWIVYNDGKWGLVGPD